MAGYLHVLEQKFSSVHGDRMDTSSTYRWSYFTLVPCLIVSFPYFSPVPHPRISLTAKVEAKVETALASFQTLGGRYFIHYIILPFFKVDSNHFDRISTTLVQPLINGKASSYQILLHKTKQWRFPRFPLILFWVGWSSGLALLPLHNKAPWKVIV